MLAARVIAVLGHKRAEGHEVFTSDMRIRIPVTGLSTYPDVAIVAGKLELASIDPDAAVNPIALVEITSPSTETYDREKKLKHYQQLPSLRHVLFVSHREPRLTLVSRQADDTWKSTEATAGQSLDLPAFRLSLSVNELYRGIFGLPD
jgi:Uma2 family endonuclease